MLSCEAEKTPKKWKYDSWKKASEIYIVMELTEILSYLYFNKSNRSHANSSNWLRYRLWSKNWNKKCIWFQKKTRYCQIFCSVFVVLSPRLKTLVLLFLHFFPIWRNRKNSISYNSWLERCAPSIFTRKITLLSCEIHSGQFCSNHFFSKIWLNPKL